MTANMVMEPSLGSIFKLLPGPANRGSEIYHSLPLINDEDISSECQELQGLIGFPLPSPSNHTMSMALFEYCQKRLPLKYIQQLQRYNIPLELHAVPYEILEKYHDHFGFVWVERLVWRLHPLKKSFNFRRPELVLAQEAATGKMKCLLTIMPGQDYVRHYASLLAIASQASASKITTTNVKAVLYPGLTQSIVRWTGLSTLCADVQPGDVAVLGFVHELLTLCQQIVPTSKILLRKFTTFYGLVRLEVSPGVVFSFLGVTYSFWGNLGGKIVEELWFRQPRAICYIGKHGTLTAPTDIHSRIFSPSRFCVFDKGELRWFSDEHAECPVNPLAARCPYFDTGLHCSVPTVAEETFQLRSSLDDLKVRSIDNEVSQMAESLTRLREQYPTSHDLQFLPILFATDYIRSEEDAYLKVKFDLTSRNETVNSNKQRFLKRVSYLLLQTFQIVDRPKAVIVGTSYGTRTILPALQKLGVDIVGLCGGRDKDKTRTLALKHKIPYTDRPLSEMQSEHGAGLLFVASPHDRHAACVQEALELGNFDIVCEKPLALDLPTIDHLALQSHKSSQLTLINQPLRFYPPFIHLKALLRHPRNLKALDVTFLTGRLARYKNWNWCFSREKGGGMLLAMATHFIDLIEWFTDSILLPDSTIDVTTRNDVGRLPLENGIESRAADVESFFHMNGQVQTLGKECQYSIMCNGTADTENFTVNLTTHEGICYRFIHIWGEPIQLHQRHPPSKEWTKLKIHMDESIWKSSPWPISFECFAEHLVESISTKDRTEFVQKATTFTGFARQIRLFGDHVGIASSNS